LPKSANEVKLISSGKILENNVTVGQCKIPFGDIEEEIITMHVHFAPPPPLTKSKAGKHLFLATLACNRHFFVVVVVVVAFIAIFTIGIKIEWNSH